jgi:hypothetical protein
LLARSLRETCPVSRHVEPPLYYMASSCVRWYHAARSQRGGGGDGGDGVSSDGACVGGDGVWGTGSVITYPPSRFSFPQVTGGTNCGITRTVGEAMGHVGGSGTEDMEFDDAADGAAHDSNVNNVPVIGLCT